MRSSLKVFLLALVLAPCANGHQISVPIIKNTHRGFDKQYKRIFNAFRKADEQELKLRFNDFAIPVHWFTDTFGPDVGPELSERYSQEFEKFIYSTTNLFESVDAAQLEEVGTYNWKYIHNAVPPPKPAPPSLRPLPTVQYFKIEYGRAGFTGPMDNGSGWEVKDWGSETRWRGAFVYVDGAFRFFGLDAYPFWDLKDDVPEGFCADSRQQGGQIVHKVRPVYPPEAKRKRIAGVVQIDITVAKDGSVKEAEIVRGNPLLQEAARQAVLQWHFYPPFRTCSQTVEGTLSAFVVFPPR